MSDIALIESGRAKMTLLEAVREWIERLDVSRVDLEQRFDEFGFSASIRPRNPKGCRVYVEVNRSETATLGCGRTVSVSDWAFDPNTLIAILEAVRAGRIQEEIWEFCGHTMRGIAAIRLEDGRDFRDRAVGLPIGKRRVITYDPW
jgi:hypothetical protein